MATAEGHSPRGDAQSRSNGDKLGPSPLNVCPERGPCKRAGVLILAKKSHLLIHLGITLLFLLLPLSPLLSHDYHLGPAGKGSKRKKTFFSAAKRPHSLSSGTCEVAALPPFPFLEDDALCSTRRTYLFGVQQILSLSCIFLLYTPFVP